MIPLFRWAGSKRKNLDVLSSYWGTSHKRYVEPFAGSACLFFHLEPERAIINDLNGDLVQAYAAIVSNPERVWKKAHSWTNTRESYYKIRALNPKSLEPHHRAARFVFLNRFCFNGIWRTNKRGDFNVPYGGEGSGQLPSMERLTQASELLGRAKLMNRDFQKTIEAAKSGDFYYLDPPYRTARRRVFCEYTKTEFQDTDLVRLKEALKHLHNVGASFVLSYADCPEARKLAQGYSSKRIVVRRNVAGFASHRRQACEVIITNIERPNDESSLN